MSKLVEIYTDGGCRCHVKKGGTIQPTDKSAYAVYMIFGEKSRIFGEGFYGKTNNEMELTAVLKALQAMKRYDIPVVVYSDSSYVVNSINNKWYVKWRLNNWNKKGGLANASLWKETISEYDKFNNITFVHVKGHNGNVGNEIVDKELNRIMDDLKDIS